MVESILLVLALLFAISGLCEFIFFVLALIFLPDIKFKTVSVVRLKPECYVQQIKFLRLKYRWYGHAFANKIVFLLDDLSKEQKQISEYFSDSAFYFVYIEDLADLLNFIETQE